MGVKGCSYKSVTLEKKKVLSEPFLMDDNTWHTEYKQCHKLKQTSNNKVIDQFQKNQMQSKYSEPAGLKTKIILMLDHTPSEVRDGNTQLSISMSLYVA